MTRPAPAWALAVLLATSAAAGAAEPALPDPVRATSTTPSAGAARKLADLAYGPFAKQRLDVYLPPVARRAPILFMVHGGAWMFGDKSSRGVIGAKVEHWVMNGWILVSVNNRLLPEATPLEQADDVARALAFVQAQAAAWGGDSTRIVLMGHSAGAHLVALLSAQPTLAASAGASRWAGTVVLDSAALDLETLMREPHPRFYDRVFGADAASWRATSPTARLGADAVPMLLVCSTLRLDDSCGQSARFAARVNAVGAPARVHREALAHNAIDVELGRPGTYTDDVDAFIGAVVARPGLAGVGVK
jgi:arylformamidase